MDFKKRLIEELGLSTIQSQTMYAGYIDACEKLAKEYCQEQVINKSDDIRSVSDWVLVSDKTPICYKSGHWDGKMSDLVIVVDSEDKCHLTNMYEYDDGNSEWYDNDEYGLGYEVVKWKKID